MERAPLALTILGIMTAPVGIYLATLERCVRDITLGEESICIEYGLPYQAPGYALLILGVLLFVAGLVLIATRRR